MPFVRITIVREVLQSDPAGRKAAISAKVAGAIAEATGLPEHEVSIVFDEVEARNWAALMWRPCGSAPKRIPEKCATVFRPESATKQDA